MLLCLTQCTMQKLYMDYYLPTAFGALFLKYAVCRVSLISKKGFDLLLAVQNVKKDLYIMH